MNEAEKETEKEEIGLQELGRVTEETKGWTVGIFADGGMPPYNRDILP